MYLHACLFGKNENCITMAHNWADTAIHLDRVKYFLDTMGSSEFKFSVTLDKDTQRELFFPQTNSRYWIGTAGSRAFGRGRDVTKLHLSEIAFYPDESVITSVTEACVPKAVKIFESTANGVGGVFYRLWKESSAPASGSPFKAHFYPWFDDPTNESDPPERAPLGLTDRLKKLQEAYNLSDRKIYWYLQKEKSLADKSLMPQEYPSNPMEAFLSSGRHCFNLHKLQQKVDLAYANPPLMTGDVEDNGKAVVFNPSDAGPLKIWKAPRQNRMYFVMADPGKGVVDGDWSVAQVFDRASWEQVAIWRGRPDPGAFGEKLCELGYYFNNAIVGSELNESGWATNERMKRNKYPHVFNTKLIWPETEQKQSWDGFPTNEKTRSLILTALRNAVDDDTAYFNDPVTIEEMMTFIQNPKTLKFEAQAQCFDDCVISAAISVFCLQFLSIDESYGDHTKNLHRGSPRLQTLLKNKSVPQRGSSTGYR